MAGAAGNDLGASHRGTTVTETMAGSRVVVVRPMLLPATRDKVSTGAAEPGVVGAPKEPAPGAVALPGPELSSMAGVRCVGIEAAAEDPTTIALGLTSIVEISASSKNSKLVGSNGDVDISEKGNMDSLKYDMARNNDPVGMKIEISILLVVGGVAERT